MSDDMIVNTVNNAMYHLERSPEMQATRELITNQLKFAGYSEAQSYSIVQLMDAYARATGDVPGWYDKYFSGIKVLDSIEDITDPNALFKSPFEDYGKKAINEILDGAGFDDAQLDRFSLVRIQKMTGVPEDILENLVPKPYRQLVSIFLSTPHGADFLPKGVSEKIGKEIVEH
ncbi:MAG: hypothetical protein GWN14_21425, partial [candidate division Zixibacteria bacterium]|nr:hypothetical protein [candidate division Zixibacteria bacterium]